MDSKKLLSLLEKYSLKNKEQDNIIEAQMTHNKIDIALTTYLEMVQQRGYHDYTIIKDIVVAVNMKTNHMIAVFLLADGKLTIDQIKSFISQTCQIELNHCIIIFNDTITPIARQHIHSIPDIHCELFTVAELQYNITKHNFIPKHTRLSTKQSQLFKERYGTKYPNLSINEPISRFYDYRVGDVIKIDRDGGYITYRIVNRT